MLRALGMQQRRLLGISSSSEGMWGGNAQGFLFLISQVPSETLIQVTTKQERLMRDYIRQEKAALYKSINKYWELCSSFTSSALSLSLNNVSEGFNFRCYRMKKY